jgi:hypothetical protein
VRYPDADKRVDVALTDNRAKASPFSHGKLTVELEFADGSADEVAFFRTALAKELTQRGIAGTVTQERWEEIVEDTRRAFGAAGNVTQRGAVYEWKAGAERDGYQARLTLSTKDGKTKAHLVSNRRAEAGVLFVSLSVLVALLTFLTFTIAGLGVFSSFGVAAASLLVFWVMARFAFRSYSGKKRRTFEALLDRAEARLAEAEPAATEAVAPAWDTAEPNTPILDLDEPEPDPETAPGTRRKTSA